jgi:putative surface cell wall-binding protein
MQVRMTAAVVAALGALGVAAGPAQAADDTTSIAISAGALTYVTPLAAANFPAVTLNGLQQTARTSISPFVVNDARGGSAGWNLTVEASQFTHSNGSDTLPAGSMSMALPPVPTTTVGNLGTPPVVTGTALQPLDGGSAQKVVSAPATPLSGAGQWTFTPLADTLTLLVPAAVEPGTYTSTITSTLSTGP